MDQQDNTMLKANNILSR